ncbi:unnamed protein product [Arctogadus glacialis]
MPPLAPEHCIPLVHCSAIRPCGWEKVSTGPAQFSRQTCTRNRRLPRTHRQGFAVKRVDSQRRANRDQLAVHLGCLSTPGDSRTDRGCSSHCTGEVWQWRRVFWVFRALKGRGGNSLRHSVPRTGAEASR